jgi:hypothetical protein
LLGKPAAKDKTGKAFFRHDLPSQNANATDYWLNLLDRERHARVGRLQIENVVGPAVDRLRNALDRKVTLKLNGRSTSEVLADLRKEAPGLHIQATEKGPAWEGKVTATLTEVPLGAALQLLEDVLTGHRIVVREYGLLIVPQEKVPPGAVMLEDFWKAGSKTTPTGANVQGAVISVGGNLMRISLGADHGVKKDQVLHVARIDAKSGENKYLGTIKVVEVQAQGSVGQVTGKPIGEIRSGDKVFTTIQKR